MVSVRGGGRAGPVGGVQGPRADGQRVARRRVARPPSASAISTTPDQVLDQYIGAAIENLASRMNEEMSTQTPSTRLVNCRPGNPRRLNRANGPMPAPPNP